MPHIKYNKLFTEFINSVNNKNTLIVFIQKYGIKNYYSKTENAEYEKPALNTIKRWYAKYINQNE